MRARVPPLLCAHRAFLSGVPTVLANVAALRARPLPLVPSDLVLLSRRIPRLRLVQNEAAKLWLWALTWTGTLLVNAVERAVDP